MRPWWWQHQTEMKNNLFLFILSVLFFEVRAQKVYTDKSAYERAIVHYTHALESYDNYIRKKNFYSRLKYPRAAVDTNGDRFLEPVVDLMLREGIRLDNNTNRFHADVEPTGEMNFYYFEDPVGKYLKVVIMAGDTSGYIHASTTYSFRHPGKSPVYKPEEKKSTVQKTNIPVIPIRRPENTDVAPVTSNVEKVFRHSYYLMPNGDRYPNRESLTRAYPMFANERVFSFYFEKE